MGKLVHVVKCGRIDLDGCPDEFWKDHRSTSVSIFEALDLHGSLSMAGVSQPSVVGDLLGGVWIGASGFRLTNPRHSSEELSECVSTHVEAKRQIHLFESNNRTV